MTSDWPSAPLISITKGSEGAYDINNALLDDGTNGGPRNDLLEMGGYALAWAAQIIEEEE